MEFVWNIPHFPSVIKEVVSIGILAIPAKQDLFYSNTKQSAYKLLKFNIVWNTIQSRLAKDVKTDIDLII